MVFPKKAGVSCSLTTFFKYFRLRNDSDDIEEIKNQQAFPILSARFQKINLLVLY